MRRSLARPTIVDLDADELAANSRRAAALGLVVVRLDALGPTPVDDAAIDRLRRRIAERVAARAKKART